MELLYGPGDQSLNSNYASGQNANYNGNITMIKSRTQGQSVTPTYGFMYDGLNRLTAAYYGEKGTSTYSNLDRYTEYQSYDLNGNILSLDRYGLAGGSAGAIDDLNYTYTLNSNQISGISELVTNTTFRDKGFKYYSSGTNTYDAAGNVTNEPSKGAVIAQSFELTSPFHPWQQYHRNRIRGRRQQTAQNGKTRHHHPLHPKLPERHRIQ